jgi:hypothetical protein
LILLFFVCGLGGADVELLSGGKFGSLSADGRVVSTYTTSNVSSSTTTHHLHPRLPNYSETLVLVPGWGVVWEEPLFEWQSIAATVTDQHGGMSPEEPFVIALGWSLPKVTALVYIIGIFNIHIFCKMCVSPL